MRTTDKASKKAETKPEIALATIQAPDGCVTARVREADALWIARRCKQSDKMNPWIVAGVLAQAGGGVIRNFHGLGDKEPERLLGTSTANSLWSVINRDIEDYTHEVLVAIPETVRIQMDDDCQAMRRDLSDWLGTLIKAGIKMVEVDENLAFLTSWRGFTLLADSIELEALKAHS